MQPFNTLKENITSYHNHELIIRTFDNQIGKQIIINRPNAQNAIPSEMFPTIEKLFRMWDKDEKVKFVVLTSESNIKDEVSGNKKKKKAKAFCAGGDLKQITDFVTTNKKLAEEFIYNEYRADCYLHRFSKPWIAIIDGYTMGGGCGVSLPSTFTIATQNTLWAMPECAIGFHVDVGSNYHLSRMPGHIGEFLGLTGHRLRADDCMYCGISTHYLCSSNIDKLLSIFNSHESSKLFTSCAKQNKSIMQNLLDQYCTSSQSYQKKHKPPILKYEEIINRCFGKKTVLEIVEKLRQEKVEIHWCKSITQKILKSSPTSLSVTLKMIQLARTPEYHTIEQCLELNYAVGCRLYEHSNDFVEGVRALLRDRDNNPKWNPATLEQIDENFINLLITPLPTAKPIGLVVKKVQEKQLRSKL